MYFLIRGRGWVVHYSIILVILTVCASFLVAPAAATPSDSNPPAPPLNTTADDNVSDSLFPADEIKTTEQTSVTIVATATPGNETAAETVLAENGTVEHQYADQIQATVPQDQLTALGADPAIAHIREPRKPTQGQEDLVSEGLSPINAPPIHDAGITGNDTTVAVLDSSFDPGHSAIADSVVETKDFSGTGIATGSTTHGDGTAELVTDVAPDTDLVLVSYETGVEYANAVAWINEHDDIDVAVTSIGWYGLPLDGTSYIGDAIESGTSSETVWVSSAGNHGDNTHWYDTVASTPNGEFIQFANDNECNWVETDQSFQASLQWTDWQNTDQRYGLIVYQYNPLTDQFSEVTVSNENQLLGIAPWEQVTVPEAGEEHLYCIAAFADTTDEAVTLDLFLRSTPAELEYASPERSVTVPATHPDVLAVGAVNWWSGALASYSSRGPTIDGRQKPDIGAPTGVSTVAYGPEGYGGTSAAAPHVAGGAALLASQNDSLTAPEIANQLTETAQPTAGTGVEFDGDETFTDADLPNTQVGTGLIDIEAAVDEGTPPVQPDPTITYNSTGSVVFKGQSVFVTGSEINAGGDYQLHRATTIDDGLVTDSTLERNVEAVPAAAVSEEFSQSVIEAFDLAGQDVIRINSTHLAAGNYFITGEGLPAEGELSSSDTVEIAIQRFNAEFDSDAPVINNNIEDGSATLAVDSNRGQYSINVTANGELDQQELFDIFAYSSILDTDAPDNVSARGTALGIDRIEQDGKIVSETANVSTRSLFAYLEATDQLDEIERITVNDTETLDLGEQSDGFGAFDVQLFADNEANSNNKIILRDIPDTTANVSAIGISANSYALSFGVHDTEASEELLMQTDADESDNNDVELSIAPSTQQVSAGGVATFDVIVENADNGLGAYEFAVTVADTDTATVVAATETRSGGSGTDPGITGDGSQVEFNRALLDDSFAPAELIVIGSVDILMDENADSATELSIQTSNLGDLNGNGYTVNDTATATIELVDIPDVTGNGQPATDTTGDGKFDDVNGDGSSDVLDVQALFQNSNGEAIQNNINKFDFNGDGAVDILDVQALFQQL